jgi:hypothetical protein
MVGGTSKPPQESQRLLGVRLVILREARIEHAELGVALRAAAEREALCRGEHLDLRGLAVGAENLPRDRILAGFRLGFRD